MYKREAVYAVMRTPLFKATFKYANLLYGISNYAYALKLLENRAHTDWPDIIASFSWMHSKEGHDYWVLIHELQSKRYLELPL